MSRVRWKYALTISAGLLLGACLLRPSPVLRQVNTVSVSGAEHFIAKDHIKEVNIGWIGGNFNSLFLAKIENKVLAGKLAVYRLQKDSLNAPIMSELGNRAEISLAHFFELLKKQAEGQKGLLLVDGSANFFYLRADNADLWGVSVYWDEKAHSWDIAAYATPPPDGWDAGAQLFSRK